MIICRRNDFNQNAIFLIPALQRSCAETSQLSLQNNIKSLAPELELLMLMLSVRPKHENHSMMSAVHRYVLNLRLKQLTGISDPEFYLFCL